MEDEFTSQHPRLVRVQTRRAHSHREIIAELDPRLTSEDLDGIIEEIDEDGSGTMDFDEFCQMMMS